MDKADTKARRNLASVLTVGVIVVTFLLGLVISFSPSFVGASSGSVHDLLTNVGFGLVGTALGAVLAAIPLLFLGNQAFKQEEVISQAFAQVSNLVASARKLGIVAIGANRSDSAFENQTTLVQRWQYLLEHADEVDLLCLEDKRLLDFSTMGDDIQATVRERLGNGQNKNPLTLRILISDETNPALPLVDRWAKGGQNLLEGQVHLQLNQLSGVLGVHERQTVVRHHELLPFTLLRGDTYMYVMFFFPGRDPGPIIELRKREAMDASSGQAITNDLFKAYSDLFENLWKKYTQGNP